MLFCFIVRPYRSNMLYSSLVWSTSLACLELCALSCHQRSPCSWSVNTALSHCSLVWPLEQWLMPFRNHYIVWSLVWESREAQDVSTWTRFFSVYFESFRCHISMVSQGNASSIWTVFRKEICTSERKVCNNENVHKIILLQTHQPRAAHTCLPCPDKKKRMVQKVCLKIK
jgi:hypothetical protein